MTLVEVAFKEACRDLIRQGIHPTPTPLNEALGRARWTMNNLNGRECRWLREDMGIPPIRRRRRFNEYAEKVLRHTDDLLRCHWNCCTGNGRVPSIEVRHG